MNAKTGRAARLCRLLFKRNFLYESFRSKKNLLLLAASVIVWLGTCLLATHWNTVYDGAVGGFPAYLWVFAPVALIFNIFMNSRPSNPDGRDHSRWAQALLVFLVALCCLLPCCPA